ncbi:hypothetical protein A6770_06585 [Nostoc minutum NIES-26]|uniref:Uncharacterized protein n=1 Tax=Nostoc minutum NIES-26 TaxID=1844469 RepID=A0A367Q234_9NOSO|nr:hypothetical protein A6770_06585 [Nostoc minutum NIES-26]
MNWYKAKGVDSNTKLNVPRKKNSSVLVNLYLITVEKNITKLQKVIKTTINMSKCFLYILHRLPLEKFWKGTNNFKFLPF